LATPFWYNTALQLYNQECLERFGPFEPPKNVRAIWFHAVSVGETNAAQPLIEHYLKLGQPVLVTNTTKTGQARAKSLFLKAPYLDLFQAVYLPVDQKHLLKQFFELYQPKLLALVETELWPNLIDQAKLQQVPCLLLNARLSEKSAKGYSRVSGLTAGMLKQIDWVLAQDNATRQRYVELGLDQQKSQVVGNIKFDIHAPEAFINQAEQLQQQWYLGQRKVLTIASTHAPEEQQILQALAPYLKTDPDLVCIVVPRHPERFDEVFEICQNLDLITHRRSMNHSIHASTQVYLADSMGELWLWYALSQVCFVGGSLNEPGGGHNILEPMVLNVPTVIGPRYFNFQTIVDEFIDENGVLIAQDAEQVVAIWMACLAEPEEAKQVVEQAHKVLQRNQGSLQKHIGVINRYLVEKP
jgi:3-deoxy-D-manno-octulosonic-acid transferase